MRTLRSTLLQPFSLVAAIVGTVVFILAGTEQPAFAQTTSAALDAPASARGTIDEPPKPIVLGPDVLVEVQIVSMPLDLAAGLVPELLDAQRIDGAYAKVQALLTEKKAQLVGWPIVITKSGTRGVFESIEEIRYPAAYKPPQVAAQIVTPPAAKKDEPPLKFEPKIDMSAFDAVPAEFETRNAGVTLEVEPVVLEGGKLIALDLVPQHVALIGMRKSTIEKPATGAKIVVEQPDFSTVRITAGFTLRDGQRLFLGMHQLSKPEGHAELFLLKASIIPHPVGVQ